MPLKIAVLTSSRADYGIYKPLLQKLSQDTRFEIDIIVFGMHLLPKYGNTKEEIVKDNYGNIHLVSGMNEGDTPEDIAEGYAEIVKAFSVFWTKNSFDWVLALGDRFEMSAAVQAGIPLEINFAHIHGGETTLGALDNIYRHQISLASKLHFVSTEEFKNRVFELTHEKAKIHVVGALSLDGIEELALPKWIDVCAEFGIPEEPFVLVTFHPETVNAHRNVLFSEYAFEALKEVCKERHVVITLSNADAMGSLYTEKFKELKALMGSQVSLVDNFGRLRYFSAMANCEYLIGNTSSGILEAASFRKYVVNVGDRQAGRIQSENIINCQFDKDSILKACRHTASLGEFDGENKLFRKGTVKNIIDILYNEEL